MNSNEHRMALLLVGAVLVIGIGGVMVIAPILRGDTQELAGGAAADRTATGVSRSDDRLDRLENRMTHLESILSEIRADLAAIERSGRSVARPTAAAGDTSSSPATLLDPADLTAIETLFEDEDVREVLLDAVEQASIERSTNELRSASRAAESEREKKLSAMGEAIGLSLYEQDAVDELMSEAQRQHDELTARAAEVLLSPGALDDEVREAYQAMMVEKRQIYVGRNETLKSTLGDDKYRQFRLYESQQNKKSELYDKLSGYGLPQAPKKSASRSSDRDKNRDKNK